MGSDIWDVMSSSGEDSGSLLKKPCVQGFDHILVECLGNTGAGS